jgi:hypothetical protein
MVRGCQLLEVTPSRKTPEGYQVADATKKKKAKHKQALQKPNWQIEKHSRRGSKNLTIIKAQYAPKRGLSNIMKVLFFCGSTILARRINLEDSTREESRDG